MSGETSDNDGATIGSMLPYVWLSAKNKAIVAARHRLMKKSKNDDIKPAVDAAGDFDSPLLLTHHSFKNDSIIARPVGGTASEPVELADENEMANPDWNMVCSTRKDQRRVDKQLARRTSDKALTSKRKAELMEQMAKTKVKKEKQKNIKAV
jgi:hypothetical protein